MLCCRLRFVFSLVLGGFLTLGSWSKVSAQQSNLTPNEFTPLTTNIVGGVTVKSSETCLPNSVPILPDICTDDFSSEGNVIDPTITNNATWDYLIGGTAWIEVEDANATTGEEYPAGSYAGFVVGNSGLLELLGNTTVTTYLDDVAQETVSAGSLLTLGVLSGQSRVGFYTSQKFDKIRLTVSAAGLLNNVTVYYAEVKKFMAGPQPACNTNTTLTSPEYPVIVQRDRTGFTGGVNVGTITNRENAVDDDPNTSASITMPLGVLSTANFSIQDRATTFSAGAFAGIDLDNPALLGLNLLGSLTITTYLDGQSQEAISGSNLLSVPSSLLSGTGRQTVGFKTTKDFDEVRVTMAQTGLDLRTTRIYGMVVKEFCPGTIADCNTLTPGTNPEFPVYINGANTGVDIGVCAACSINNTENVIDNDMSSYATVDFAVGALTDISLSVANALDEYDANTFVGFELGLQPLLDVDVLGSTTIELFNDGVSVQTGSGDALLAGVTSTILQGGFSRQPVGIIANQTFDEVKITFNQNAQVNLGTIRIYHALFTTTCAGTLSCNETNFLIGGKDNLPVYINSERTGTSGVVGASKIENPWNVANDNPDDFADVEVIANVAGSASISVVDATNTYPAGAIAGFVISNESSLSQLNLFESLTITTYLDGTPQETGTGDDLLNLDLLGIITIPGAEFQPSFMTTLPFDEVQISFAGVANVLNHAHVYSAFADLRYVNDGGAYTCNIGTFNPDFNATWINLPVVGDVSTNDQPNGSASYGSASPQSGNPSGGSLNLSIDGSYDFTASSPGVYRYDIPIMGGGTTTSRTLQITVLDGNSTSNPPVVNPDFGSGPQGDPIVINSVANDGPGNDNIPLDTSSVSIITTPNNGSTSINTTTGVITYTPEPGFTGRDSLEYRICDQGTPANCGTAWQYFTVNPDGVDPWTDATDDYGRTPYGEPVTGNVSTNDVDPQGEPQTVNAQNITEPGVGTFVLTADGSYTFTPADGFSGAHAFTYTTCRTNDGSICAQATVHVMVEAGVPDLVPNIIINPSIFSSNQSFNITIRVLEFENAASEGTTSVLISQSSTWTLNINQNDVINGWTYIGQQGPFHRFDYTQIIPGFGIVEFQVPATFNGSGSGKYIFTTTLAPGSGGEINTSNNTDQETSTYNP